jgi:hypothetical protein
MLVHDCRTPTSPGSRDSYCVLLEGYLRFFFVDDPAAVEHSFPALTKCVDAISRSKLTRDLIHRARCRALVSFEAWLPIAAEHLYTPHSPAYYEVSLLHSSGDILTRVITATNMERRVETTFIPL